MVTEDNQTTIDSLSFDSEIIRSQQQVRRVASFSELIGSRPIFGSVTTEAQHGANELCSLPNTNKSPRRSPSSGAKEKGKRPLVSNDSSNPGGKSTKKRRRQPSASQRAEADRKAEGLQELINEISKYRHRLDRLTKNEEKVYNEIVCSVAERMFGLGVERPVLPDLKNVKKDMKEINEEIKSIEGTGTSTEVKKKLARIREKIEKIGEDIEKIREKIEEFKEKQQEDLKKVENLEDFFINEGVNEETLKKKLSAAFPSLFRGKIETNGPTADQDQGSMPTREQLQNQLFAKDKNKLDVEGRWVKRNIPPLVEDPVPPIENVPIDAPSSSSKPSAPEHSVASIASMISNFRTYFDTCFTHFCTQLTALETRQTAMSNEIHVIRVRVNELHGEYDWFPPPPSS